MTREKAAFIAGILIYMIYMAGMLMLFYDDLGVLMKRWEMRHRLRTVQGGGRRDDLILRRLGDLLLAATGRETGAGLFAGGLLAVFVIVFAIAVSSFTVPAALLAALLCAALPVLFLIVRVESARTRGSREGISFISELHRQYRIQNKNIFEALEKTIAAKGDYPVCRRQSYRLLLRLRSSAGRGEIRAAADSFAFALGTTWGYMLATCIRMSAEKGIDVSEGLADIARQLKTANQRAEERRRLNSEAGRMTVFLVPILYLGTALISVRYLGVSPARLVRNQFLTPEGFLFFLGTVFLFLINLMLTTLVDSTKLDY